MNTAVSKICRWVFCGLLSIYSFSGYSGHMLGTDITYQYVSPGVYHVKVRWYRDCQGLPAGPQIAVCYSSATCGLNYTANLTFAGPGVFLPPFPYTPPATSSCIGGPGFGVERVEYTGVITLPSACSDWVISYSTFPQNVGMNQNFLYVSTQIDNINYPVNSSASYSFDPTFMYCVNQPAWNNFASTDADGDSLSYHLVPLLDNTTPCPPAPFQNPLQTWNQLQSSTPIAMDSLNGSMTFTPTTLQQAFCSARVDEFRGGVLINSSTIEHLVFIITGCVITGMDQQEPLGLEVHPNPVNEMLIVSLTNHEVPLYIQATDLSGKISEINYTASANATYSLDVKNLSQGIYTLRVVTENAASVKRFVKL